MLPSCYEHIATPPPAYCWNPVAANSDPSPLYSGPESTRCINSENAVSLSPHLASPLHASHSSSEPTVMLQGEWAPAAWQPPPSGVFEAAPSLSAVGGPFASETPAVQPLEAPVDWTPPPVGASSSETLVNNIPPEVPLEVCFNSRIPLGEKGRGELKAAIRNTVKQRPELRKRVNAVAKLRCATIPQLLQIAKICGLWQLALQISQRFMATRSGRQTGGRRSNNNLRVCQSKQGSSQSKERVTKTSKPGAHSTPASPSPRSPSLPVSAELPELPDLPSPPLSMSPLEREQPAAMASAPAASSPPSFSPLVPDDPPLPGYLCWPTDPQTEGTAPVPKPDYTSDCWSTASPFAPADSGFDVCDFSATPEPPILGGFASGASSPPPYL